MRYKIEKLGQYIFTLGWVYYLVNLPFQWKYIPTALGMMIAGLGWLMLMASKRGKVRFTGTYAPYLSLLILFYLLGLILHLSDFEPRVSAKIVGIQTPLWVWPLMFMLQRGNKSFFNFKQVKILFLLPTALSALITVIRFSYYQWIINEPLGYRFLSPYDFIPVHYLAMLYSFALLWGAHHFIQSKKLLYLIMSVLFLIAVLLLNVRIQWLVLLIGLSSLLVFHKLYLQKWFWVFTPILTLIITSAFLLPEGKRRLQETRDELYAALGNESEKQTNSRVYLWKYALQVISEKPLLGYRPGHADKALQVAYENCDAPFWDGEGVYHLKDRKYNYHNTFLQAWADRGLMGFLILVFMFLGALFTKTSFELKLFALVFSISFITESMLDRQAGVFFFAFLFPLLSNYKIRNPADQ